MRTPRTENTEKLNCTQAFPSWSRNPLYSVQAECIRYHWKTVLHRNDRIKQTKQNQSKQLTQRCTEATLSKTPNFLHPSSHETALQKAEPFGYGRSNPDHMQTCRNVFSGSSAVPTAEVEEERDCHLNLETIVGWFQDWLSILKPSTMVGFKIEVAAPATHPVSQLDGYPRDKSIVRSFTHTAREVARV